MMPMFIKARNSDEKGPSKRDPKENRFEHALLIKKTLASVSVQVSCIPYLPVLLIEQMDEASNVH
jgi:hypothetical protein